MGEPTIESPKPESLSLPLNKEQYIQTLRNVIKATQTTGSTPLMPKEPQAWATQMDTLIEAGELQENQQIGNYMFYRIVAGDYLMNLEIRALNEATGLLVQSKLAKSEDWQETGPPIAVIDFDSHVRLHFTGGAVPGFRGHLDLFSKPYARVGATAEGFDKTQELKQLVERTGVPVVDGKFTPEMFTDSTLQ